MPQWTREQKIAIDQRKGTLLLSAAAGSGKTAVLVQRVIDILADDGDPVSPQELLVVTFTNAAAAQMRQRIREQFQKLCDSAPENLYLRQQAAALSSARISTVHSFCAELIRQNFHLLDLAADSKLCQQEEMDLLGREVLEDCLEEHYGSDPDFGALLELLSSRGDDSELAETIGSLYRFLRSRPFYLDWLDQALAPYSQGLSPEESPWGQLILAESRRSLADILEELRSGPWEGDLAWAEELEPLLQAGDWDPIFQWLLQKGEIKLKNSAAAQLQKLLREKWFCCSAKSFGEDLQRLRPVLKTLFDLVKDYDHRLEEEKRRRRLLDFGDLEQLSIRLLVQRGEDGALRKSPLAQELSRQLRYVLVDEYQDSNQSQELIFQSLSREDNLFMVGDVKQSIYRFRQADPSIFLGKKQAFHDYDGENFPAKLSLSHNFRSRRQVTEAVNQLFCPLMREDSAELRYEGSEELFPAGAYEEAPGYETEYHRIITRARSFQDGEAVAQEAAVAARQVARLLRSGLTVQEGDGRRPLTAGDICILLRSPKNQGAVYLQALSREGLPVLAQGEGDYLNTVEISTAISLLETVENPLRDIPLTATLLSAAFRLNPDDLARIRLRDRSRSLYQNIVDLAAEGETACSSFLESLRGWQLRASAEPGWRLIQDILEESGLMAYAAALEGGEQRQANLRLLVDYARRWESWGYEGLDGFLRYLDKLRQQEQTLSPALLPPEQEAVQIMSIHKSKGLEFPVVLLCGCAKPFSNIDFTKKIAMDPQLGFACVSGDPKGESSYSTLPLEALRLAQRRQNVAEELRLLYVALTRAKEKLLITGLVKEKKEPEPAPLSGFRIRQAGSYSDWLELLLSQPERAPGIQIIEHPETPPEVEKEIPQSEMLPEPAADPQLLAQLRQLLHSSYPDPASCLLPPKLTVTQLVESQGGGKGPFSKEPSFLLRQGLSAAQRGTAMHNFLSYGNHRAAQEDLEGEIARLVEGQFLRPEEAASLDRPAIQGYYASELFARISASPWVQREYPFLLDLGKEELGELLPGLGEQRIAVQGVADLIFEEEDAIILVDFKTDHLPEEELRQKYAPQLELYSLILGRLLDKPIGQRLIYSLFHKKTLPI